MYIHGLFSSHLCNQPTLAAKPDVRLEFVKCLPLARTHSCYLGECVTGYLFSAVCRQSMPQGKVKSGSKLLPSGVWVCVERVRHLAAFLSRPTCLWLVLQQ